MTIGDSENIRHLNRFFERWLASRGNDLLETILIVLLCPNRLWPDQIVRTSALALSRVIAYESRLGLGITKRLALF